MHSLDELDFSDKPRAYAELAASLRGLLSGETDPIANAANTTALIFSSLPGLNWCGFYRFDGPGGELLLGPFQGRPACVRIPVGKGVCGTAAMRRTTLVVPDVHAFPGHIACDSASNSEIVVPVTVAGQLIGVLDLDSPQLARFDEADAKGLETLVEVFVAATLLR